MKPSKSPTHYNKKCLSLFLVFFCCTFLTLSAKSRASEQTISWKDADKYYGKYVTVEGDIVRTYNSGRACFLNFHENWKEHFSVVIFSSDFSKFQDSPEKMFLNKKVKVTGTVKEYKGRPEIIVKSPNSIEIIGEAGSGQLEETNVKNTEEILTAQEVQKIYESLTEQSKKALVDYLKFLMKKDSGK